MQKDMNHGSSDFSSLEETLRSMRPSPGDLDREQLMYSAGQQSARVAMTRSRHRWMISTASMCCVSLVLGAMLVTEQADRPMVVKADLVEKVPPAEETPPQENIPQVEEPAAPSSYESGRLERLARLRRRIFDAGSRPTNYLVLRDMALLDIDFDNDLFDRWQPSQEVTTSVAAPVILTSRQQLQRWLEEEIPSS